MTAREKAMAEQLSVAIQWMDLNGVYPLNWIETARLLVGKPHADLRPERDNKEGRDG